MPGGEHPDLLGAAQHGLPERGQDPLLPSAQQAVPSRDQAAVQEGEQAGVSPGALHKLRRSQPPHLRGQLASSVKLWQGKIIISVLCNCYFLCYLLYLFDSSLLLLVILSFK